MQKKNIYFLCLLQFMLSVSFNLRVIFAFLGLKMGYFAGWGKVQMALGSTHTG